MSKQFEVSIHDRIIGNIFKRDHRKITITDKEISFDKKPVAYPLAWRKNEITVSGNAFNTIFEVRFLDNNQPKAIISTYTKRIYLLYVLPTILISPLVIYAVASTVTNFADYSIPIVLTVVLASFSMQYIPYARLRRELKRHGFIS